MSTTLASDDFNRSNENPIAGNWSKPASNPPEAGKILSNAIVGSSASVSATAYYNAIAWPANQWSQVTVGTVSSGRTPGPAVRVSASVHTQYNIEPHTTAASYTMWKYVAGVTTELAASTNAIASGDVVRLDVFGQTLIGFKNGVANLSATDNTIAEGNSGIKLILSTDPNADDWFGGETKDLYYDAAVEVQRTGTTDPQTWTHTPAGTPKGIVVAICHGTESTDLVSTVTYGGVSMARVRSDAATSTEPGRTYLYFLGASIPTGNQTVSVDLASATATDIHFVSISLAGVTGNMEVIDNDGQNGVAANPSLTLQYGGRTALAIAVLYSGVTNVVTGVAPNANCVLVHDFDIAAFGSSVFRQRASGTADFVIGATVASDDVAYSCLAVAEIPSARLPPGVFLRQAVKRAAYY